MKIYIATPVNARKEETLEEKRIAAYNRMCEIRKQIQERFPDAEFHSSFDEHIAPNTSCYLRVTNRTSEMLYMNLLDIDRQGNKYLVLPMDAAATCSHLLVPPMTTVSFKKEPFIFGDEPSEETLLLMAVREPVDFSIVMDHIKIGGKSTMHLGLNRRFYQVK